MAGISFTWLMCVGDLAALQAVNNKDPTVFGEAG